MNRKVYTHFNTIGWENVKIILIQEFNLESRQQLLREEDKIIQLNLENDKCLNTRRPFYGLEKREQRKVYKTDNKEYIFQQNKDYVERNREKVSERRRKYRENNKQQISDAKKLWYENNKERILNKHHEIITCTCGVQIQKVSLQRHMKTKKHLKNTH